MCVANVSKRGHRPSRGTYESQSSWTNASLAKAAGNHRTGLKLTISGPFFIGLLVGVGCRMVFHIERGDLLDILEHSNPDRYAAQSIFVVRREGYVYLVPFVEDEHTVFLKTIIPSRKPTKQYLGEESDDET